ncbi:MAG: NADP-dependent phosphogluconate dehydrogenase [Planctomycetota bacterium]
MSCSIAVLGLGTMGSNLALNLADNGFEVALWNRHSDRTREIEKEHDRFVGCETLEDVVSALSTPRSLLLMVPAGAPVDDMIEKLVPLLSPGDLIIDGGNSFFEDTRRRDERLAQDDLLFMGLGVSGGEDGARHGPSLMPGGPRKAYDRVADMLEAISAKSDSGPCVTYLGPDGAGHFVKMVHNGIEYADMQLIAECYDLLRRGLDQTASEAAEVFADWNEGPLASYLIEITAEILKFQDEKTGKPLVDFVSDQAQQKGTGRWTVSSALELGVAVPTIAAAVDARVLSSDRRGRQAAAEMLDDPEPSPIHFSTDVLGDALLAARIIAYAQGMQLIQRASAVHDWGIDLSEVARIWTAGCIIRARLLDDLQRAWSHVPELANLVLDKEMHERVPGQIREVLAQAVRAGVPVPCFSASLAWFDTVRTANLPTNLTQAQRDAFGAHTYHRLDDLDGPAQHSEWLP